MGVYSNVVT